ncbi:hypothetical protein RCL1_008705 [Eukaryota sp. TZLM3-RCL]
MYCRRSPQSFVLGARDVLKVLKKPVLPVGKVEVCTLIQFSTVVIQSDVRDNKKSLLYCCPYKRLFLNSWKKDLTADGDVHKNPGPVHRSVPYFDMRAHVQKTLRRPQQTLRHDLNLHEVDVNLQLNQLPVIHFSQQMLPGPCQTILCFDIETVEEGMVIQPPFRTADDTIAFFKRQHRVRNAASKRLQQMNDQQRMDWKNKQRVVAISLIVAKFNGSNLFVQHRAILYTATDRHLDSIDDCPEIDEIHHYTTEGDLLQSFSNWVSYFEPDYFVGHNIKDFDIPVIRNRAHHHRINISFVSRNVHNLLSDNWRLIAGIESILDTLQFARHFIDIPHGNSLANLSWKFLCEKKMQIVPKYPKLLPCDVMDLGEGYCTHFLHYCFNDSVLSLKLFLLFQLGAQQFSSYRVFKQSAPKLFKHDEVLLQLQDSVDRYHLLRTHVSMCFAAWTEALLKIDQHDLFVPTDITCQTYYAIAAIIHDIAGKQHNQNYPDSTSATYVDLKDFIRGMGMFTQNSPTQTPGYVHLVNQPQVLSDMFLDLGRRPFNYMSQQLFDNLEVNIKSTYRQYVQSLINRLFCKEYMEEKLKDFCKQDPIYRGFSKIVLTAFRYRLKQIKDIFYDSHLTDVKFENYDSVCHPLNVTKDWLICEIFEIIDDNTSHKFNQLFSTGHPTGYNNYPNLVDVIYPSQYTDKKGETQQVETLTQALNANPVSFLANSLVINSVIEREGGRPYQVIPLVTDLIPGYMDIDTNILAAIVNKAKSTIGIQNLTQQQNNCLRYRPQTFQNMNFEQQQSYWTNFVNIPAMRTNLFRFGNIISTNGIFCSIQLTRHDLVGKPRGSKSDAAHETKLKYITDVPISFYNNKKVVYCDPGKKDVVMLGTLSENDPVQDVDYTTTRGKDFNFTRLTQPHMTLENRINRGILECSKRHHTDLAGIFTIEEWETQLSLTPSRTTSFDKFRLYVTAKSEVQVNVKQFYNLEIWRIHKMQNFSHKKSVLDGLAHQLRSKLNVQNPAQTVIVYGDWSKKSNSNIHGQENTPGKSLLSFFQKLGYKVLLIDEHKTSSVCPRCHGPVKKVKKEDGEEIHGLLGCEVCPPVANSDFDMKLFNRNKLAIVNFASILKNHLLGQERPNVFRPREANEE